MKAQPRSPKIEKNDKFYIKLLKDWCFVKRWQPAGDSDAKADDKELFLVHLDLKSESELRSLLKIEQLI